MSKRVYDSLQLLRQLADTVTVVYRGTSIQVDDIVLFRQSLSLRAALLHDILPDEYQSAVNQYYWSLASLKDRTIDAFEYGNAVKSIGLALRLYLEKYEAGHRDSLRTFTRSLSCNYIGVILSPVYPLLKCYLAEPSAKVLRSLLHFVDFQTKLNFKSIDITDLMVEEYDAQEISMENWQYDPDIISDLNAIIQEWFQDFKVNLKGRCHHGGGSSAGISAMTKGELHKDSLLQFSDTLFRLATRWGMDPAEVPWFSKVSEADDRESELQFVPKSMITNRVISKEPVALMFLQQGLKDQLYRYFRKQRFLRRIIDLEDQTLSSGLARLGSLYGSYATLDLSAASDSVSLELVGRLFRGTDLLVPLLETRSTTTRFRDRRWRLRKFAPMGSALCFPVECIVFASICELARRKTDCRRLFRVYGDDLVVPTDYAHEVERLLEACHFRVNIRKSYVNSSKYNFREACGGEYFNGVDVTPCRLSRQLTALTAMPSGSEFASYVGLVNRLMDSDLLATRAYLLRQLQLYWSDYSVYDLIERSLDRNRGLVYYGVLNDRRTVKWLKDQQRSVRWTTHVVSRVDPKDKLAVDDLIRSEGNDPEEVRYYCWLRDATLHPQPFLPADSCLHFGPEIRPERKADVAFYPSRDLLQVTPTSA